MLIITTKIKNHLNLMGLNNKINWLDKGFSNEVEMNNEAELKVKGIEERLLHMWRYL